MAEINTNGLKANSEKRSYSVMEVAEILGVSKNPSITCVLTAPSNVYGLEPG